RLLWSLVLGDLACVAGAVPGDNRLLNRGDAVERLPIGIRREFGGFQAFIQSDETHEHLRPFGVGKRRSGGRRRVSAPVVEHARVPFRVRIRGLRPGRLNLGLSGRGAPVEIPPHMIWLPWPCQLSYLTFYNYFFPLDFVAGGRR